MKENLSLADWRKEKPKKQAGNLCLEGIQHSQKYQVIDTQRRGYQLSLGKNESY